MNEEERKEWRVLCFLSHLIQTATPGEGNLSSKRLNNLPDHSANKNKGKIEISLLTQCLVLSMLPPHPASLT
jgi:hypothetical protein